MAMPGIQRVTADGVVGISGQPIRVYSLHVVAGGGGATVVTLYNGTSSGGTAQIQLNAATSVAQSLDFSQGIQFPAGCFADVDTNTSYLLISYIQEVQAK